MKLRAKASPKWVRMLSTTCQPISAAGTKAMTQASNNASNDFPRRPSIAM